MAIGLQNKPNVTTPSAEYPYGNIKDNTGSNDGTPVNVLVYADIHQFFEKLMDEAGVSANGLPDNDTNTFQLFQALYEYIKLTVPEEEDISGSITVDPAFTVGVLSARRFIDGTVNISLVATYSGAKSDGATIMTGLPDLGIPVVATQTCLLATAALATTAVANILINNSGNSVKVLGGFSGSYTSVYIAMTYKT